MRTTIAILAALAAGPALAQGYEDYGAFGGRIGLVDVDHFGTTVTVGGYGEFGLAPQVTLNVAADFWSVTEDEGPYEVSLRDLALGGFAKYIFAPRGSRGTLSPYVGGGLALHMLRAEVEFDQGVIGSRDTAWDDNESELGLDLGVGLHIYATRDSQWVTELRLRSVDDVDHIAITVGVLKGM